MERSDQRAAGAGDKLAAYLRTFGLLSRDVRLVLIGWALVGFAALGINGLLSNLYLLRLGYGPEFIGWVSAVTLFVTALSSLPAGALGRRCGSRRPLIWGLTAYAVGMALTPFAYLIPSGLRQAWILGAAVPTGVALAVYTVNGPPFLMDLARPEERTHVFAAQSALFACGIFAGSLAGGVLPGLFAGLAGVGVDQPAPYGLSLMLAALLLAPSALLVRRTRKSAAGEDALPGIAIGDAPLRAILPMASVILLGQAGAGACFFYFNVYLDAGLHVPTGLIGVLAGGGRLASIVAALVMPLLVARWRISPIAALAALGIALGLLPLALFPTIGAAGLGFMSVMALGSIRDPALGVYQMEMVAPDWRSSMSGATGTAQWLGLAGISLGGGYTITALGYPSLFLLGAGLTTASLLLFWIFFLRRRSAASAFTAGA